MCLTGNLAAAPHKHNVTSCSPHPAAGQTESADRPALRAPRSLTVCFLRLSRAEGTIRHLLNLSDTEVGVRENMLRNGMFEWGSDW